MSPPTRSTLQLDLKCLKTKQIVPKVSPIGIAAVAVMVLASIIVSLSIKPQQKQSISTLVPLGVINITEQAEAIASLPQDTPPPASNDINQDWLVEDVRNEDTLSQIFNRLGLSSKQAYALIKHKDAEPLVHIHPGEQIEIIRRPGTTADTYTLDKLKYKYKLDTFNTLVATNVNGEYEFDTEVREPVIRYRTSTTTIQNNLFDSAQNADIPYNIVSSLTTIFGWQRDFAKDIQPGDQFSIIYEELYLDAEKVGEGLVIAAQLKSGGKILRAVRHIGDDSRINYYAPNGDGIQGSFLRTPMKVATVTSKFSNKRFNPVLKKWKAHRGVDYGAPMNTPILATGDGVVKFTGTKSGYGKTVILRHGGKYQTLYAHINHFKQGIQRGSRVKQGDVIGYVGKTGWATGTHLHYEFRVNGTHMNPLTIDLPKSAPIPKKYRSKFREDATRWVSYFEQALQLAQDKRQPVPLTQNDS